MTEAERHSAAKRLFHAVCDLTPAEQATILGRECGQDEGLRRQVEELLELDQDGEAESGSHGLGRFFKSVAATQTYRTATPGLPTKPMQVIGDFRLIRKLGEGGMGEAWEVEQLSLKRRVALKLLRSGTTYSERDLARFQREAEAGGRPTHPGIVAVYGYGHVRGTPYIAQELVGGGKTLRDFLDRYRNEAELPSDYYALVAELFARIADALEAAHRAGVIHRDVKPQNILFTWDDEPKVADFGLAKVLDSKSISETGEFAGTCYYMSPEQAMSKRMGIDLRTDIFSLGATLYEALTLRKPFEGDTSQQVLEKIVTLDPPDPRKFRSRVPRDLAVICMKMMEKRRDNRIQTMAEVAADLRRHLAHEAIVARPPGPLTRAVKWSVRHPVTAVLAVAFVAISVLLEREQSARTALQQEKNTTQEQATELGQTNADLNKLVRDLADERYAGSLQAAKTALDDGEYERARFRLVQHDTPRGWEWKHLDRRLQSGMTVVPAHDDAIRHLVFSPDGSTLASTSAFEPIAKLLDVKTAETRVTLSGHANTIASLDYSPDGRQLATGSGGWFGDEHVVFVWDLKDGSRRTVLPHDADVWAVRFFPDLVRLVTGADDNLVRVWNGLTGELLHTLAGHDGAVSCLAVSRDGSLIASGSDDDRVLVWSADTGELLKAFDGHVADLSMVSFDSAGDLILSASGDGRMLLWRPSGTAGDEVVGSLEAESFSGAIAHTADLGRIAFGTTDGVVHVWAPGTGTRWHTPALEEADSISTLAFSPDETLLASGSEGGAVSLWRADGGQSDVPRNEWFVSSVAAVAFSPDGRVLAVATPGGEIRMWEVGQRDEVSASLGTQDDVGEVAALAFSRDGSRLVSAGKRSSAGLVQLWDMQPKSKPKEILRGRSPVTSVAYSPDEEVIAFGSADGSMHVWDESMATPDSWPAHGGVIHDVGFSPDGRVILSAGGDGALRAWIVEAPHRERVLYEGAEPVTVLGFSFDSDRRYAVAGTAGGQVIRFQGSAWSKLETGRTLCHVPDPDAEIEALAVSPDGAFIALGMRDHRIVVWDVDDRAWLAPFKGHEAMVTCLAYSPDGQRLVSGSDDKTVRIWTANGVELLTLEREHRKEVTAVAWHPDGHGIVSGSTDKTLRLWLGD